MHRQLLILALLGLLHQAYSIIIQSVDLSVNVKPDQSFILDCHIAINPRTAHYRVGFLQNGSLAAYYEMKDGRQIKWWWNQEVYIAQYNANYPDFTIKINPNARNRGTYQCQVVYSLDRSPNWVVADSKTSSSWNSTTGHNQPNSVVSLKSIDFSANPKVYKSNQNFTLKCTIGIEPTTAHYRVTFQQNDKPIAYYEMNGGYLLQFINSTAYVSKGSAIYPQFTTLIRSTVKNRGKYNCELSYTTDGTTWSANRLTSLHWSTGSAGGALVPQNILLLAAILMVSLAGHCRL